MARTPAPTNFRRLPRRHKAATTKASPRTSGRSSRRSRRSSDLVTRVTEVRRTTNDISATRTHAAGQAGRRRRARGVRVRRLVLLSRRGLQLPRQRRLAPPFERLRSISGARHPHRDRLRNGKTALAAVRGRTVRASARRTRHPDRAASHGIDRGGTGAPARRPAHPRVVAREQRLQRELRVGVDAQAQQGAVCPRRGAGA